MSIQITLTKNELSPRLARLAASTNDLRPSLEAAGLQIVSITQRAFQDESLRQAPWAPKRDGSPSRLIESRALQRSIRITALTPKSVTVGTDRVYAAIQQFGGVIEPKPGNKVLVFSIGGKKVFAKKVTIPPRPFFPITPTGQLTSLAQEKVIKAIGDALEFNT